MIQHICSNNINWKRIGGGLLAALLTVSLAGCNGGGGNANNANTTATNTAPANTNANANTGASAATSDASLKEAAMTWGHIEEARTQLDKAVEDNNFNEVHNATVKIRDSVNALPGKSSALPADKREALNSQVKEVDGLGRKLGEAGDANDTDAVHQNHMAMNEALERMKGLYPDAMDLMDKGMERMEMGKEMMDKGKDKMDKDSMDKGMHMMDEGMDMMEMGKEMTSSDKVDKGMMDEGMDMMEMGKKMMGQGKDKMDKEMMDKGMHMMENGMHMMDRGKKKGGKKMNDKKMPMEKMGDKKKGMGHM